ncbi:hypothetical protein J1614_004075 [Plenodomus biglobosus]|nr:hypothetical protein J1614_004075 [Plenodomus biglobosus]
MRACFFGHGRETGQAVRQDEAVPDAVVALAWAVRLPTSRDPTGALGGSARDRGRYAGTAAMRAGHDDSGAGSGSQLGGRRLQFEGHAASASPVGSPPFGGGGGRRLENGLAAAEGLRLGRARLPGNRAAVARLTKIGRPASSAFPRACSQPMGRSQLRNV